jgi:hypothetical protein
LTAQVRRGTRASAFAGGKHHEPGRLAHLGNALRQVAAAHPLHPAVRVLEVQEGLAPGGESPVGHQVKDVEGWPIFRFFSQKVS